MSAATTQSSGISTWNTAVATGFGMAVAKETGTDFLLRSNAKELVFHLKVPSDVPCRKLKDPALASTRDGILVVRPEDVRNSFTGVVWETIIALTPEKPASRCVCYEHQLIHASNR